MTSVAGVFGALTGGDVLRKACFQYRGLKGGFVVSAKISRR